MCIGITLAVVNRKSYAGPEDGIIDVLFLGDDGHHQPAARAQQLIPALQLRGIRIHYIDELSQLAPRVLDQVDCVLIYGNREHLPTETEDSLISYVKNGGGLVAVHSACGCFGHSDKYIELVGGQFLSHETDVFSTQITEPNHPVMKGFEGFESWDETYIHQRHNPDKTVLSKRVEGDHHEPWTWVRTDGQGRVFYTAWGHDHRTWSHPGFHELLERGIRWASGDWALATDPQLAPLAYQNSQVPNYIEGGHFLEEGEPHTKLQKPLDVTSSLTHSVVPPDLDISCFVSDPDIVNPIAMTWDERGRLWIAQTTDYPNDMSTAGEGADRIVICEDTDGDQQADSFTVFAEGLSIPTGIARYRDGIVVLQAPETLFLRDTDGDDRADVREVLFSGWGTFDTHAGPSHLRWGLDNYLYMTVGYAGFNGSVGGDQHQFGQGVVRMAPDGSALEFLGSSSNNTWGLGFDETGEIFYSTANRDQLNYMAIPNRVYEQVDGWPARGMAYIADYRVIHPVTPDVRQADFHRQYTAAAGSTIYTARALPEDYWNSTAFVAEPTAHLLHRSKIKRQGSGYVAKDGWNLFASSDAWSAPIGAEVGPDGAIWMAEWYNPIIQHNPAPHGYEVGQGNAYITDQRDQSHGRIYRIHSKNHYASDTNELSISDPKILLSALGSDNMFWRQTAQRLLVERGSQDVVEPLLMMLQAQRDLDAIGSDPTAIHALWTLKGLGQLDGLNPKANEVVLGLLEHPAAAVRKNALRAMPATRQMAAAAGQRLADEDLQVVREAALAVSRLPAINSNAKLILELLQKRTTGEDQWIADAALAAAANNDAAFLQVTLSSAPTNRQQTSATEPTNLIKNGGFENMDASGAPQGWRIATYRGQADHSVVPFGRGGGNCLQIRSNAGADTSWQTDIRVEPFTDYRLRGWIRSADLVNLDADYGALLNAHLLGRKVTNAVVGNADWTPVECVFNSGDRDQISVNCLYGGWGLSTGDAFYDDLSLERLPSIETGMGKSVDRTVKQVAQHYAAHGGDEQLIYILEKIAGAEETLARPVLEAMAANWPKDKTPQLTSLQQERLQALTKSLKPMLRPSMIRLMQQWSDEHQLLFDVSQIKKDLRSIIEDNSQPSDLRIEAAVQLLAIADDKSSVELVVSQIVPSAAPELADGLIDGLRVSRHEFVAPALLEQWMTFTPQRQARVVALLTSYRVWLAFMLDAIKDGDLDSSTLTPGQWHSIETVADAELAAQAERLHKKVQPVVDSSTEELISKVLQNPGDAEQGKILFDTNCLVCHVLGDAGGQVGPALDGIGSKSPTELLIDILDPNRSVEGNYRLWSIETTDGSLISGRLGSESKTVVELWTIDGELIVVDRSDITYMDASTISVMPSTYRLTMTPEELASLTKFLQEASR